MNVDPELDRILAEEIEARLHLLEPGNDVPVSELRAALHSLRGATAMAGHIELSVLLAQASLRLRRGDPDVRGFVVDLLARAAARLRDGAAPLPTRWPQPPPGLMALPLDATVAPEYVASMRDRLAVLDDALHQGGDEDFEQAYRVVHGMKSAAAGVGDDVVAWFCHGLESALQAFSRRLSPGAPAPEQSRAVFRAELRRHRDTLALLIEEPARALESLEAAVSGAPPGTVPSAPEGLPERLVSAREPAAITRQPSAVASDELRVPAAALDRCLDRLSVLDLMQEELRAVADLAQRRTSRLRELRARLLDLPQLATELSEGELTARVEELARGVQAFAVASARGVGAVRRASGVLRDTSRELRQEVTELRVTSAGWLFSRACRGLAEQALLEDKLVSLTTSGDEVPIDRPLADKVLGALSQLLRNAVAHGIEPKEERRRRGKPLEGHIELSATRTANMLTLRVTDDGRGVDLGELRATALSLGVEPERVHASADHDLLTLLALPGLTTREGADWLAGRGLGLDMAQQAAVALGGGLSLQAPSAGGFSAVLEVPIEGALPQLLWVRAAKTPFALPLQFVQGVFPRPRSGQGTCLAGLLRLDGVRAADSCVEVLVPGLPAVTLAVEHVGDVERAPVHPVPAVVQRVGPFVGAVRGADDSLRLVLDARVIALQATAPLGHDEGEARGP